MTIAIIDGREAKPVVVGAGAEVAGSLLAQAEAAQLAAEAAAATVSDDLLRITQGLNADIFADSVAGSDTATGLAYPRAKLTLTAAQALLGSSTSRLALISDSAWRETLDMGTDRTLVSTGTGEIPVVNGADIVTTWTAEGTANVWQKTGWSHDLTSTNRLIVVEDGTILKRVANAATCSSTAGSFVDVKGSDGSTVTLKIHPTGSGNPNTNGKVYEATKRLYALKSDDALAVAGPIETRNAGSNNGSLVSLAPADLVNRVLAVNGTKHNLFGFNVRDCIGYDADPPTSYEVSNTTFVAYMDDPTGETFDYRRCGAIQVTVPPSDKIPVAFYGHGASPSVEFDTGLMEQCWAVGPINGGFHTGAASGTERGCYWDCLLVISNEGEYTVTQTLARIKASVSGVLSGVNTLAAVTFEHSAYYFQERSTRSNNSEAFRLTGGSAQGSSFTNCALFMGEGTNFNAHAFNNGTATGGTFDFDYSICAGFSGNLLQIPSGVTYSGDFNVFWYNNTFAPTRGFEATHHGTQYTTLTGWQTATSADANSVYILAADQVAGDADAFWLAWAQASSGTDLATIGPAVGDFRINPNAKVYKADGTALTGTFANGTTPITAAGPQVRWDWNRRESVSGAPRAFPSVPATLANSRAYVAAPMRWAA